MGWRHPCGVLGSFFAVLIACTGAIAASFDVQSAKATTEELTGKNAASMVGMSSAIPDTLRIEVIQMVQALEVSRDRINLLLDRMDKGLFPLEEGVERLKGIAGTAAQREREFLQGLIGRVPAPIAPEVAKALAVSTDSWEGVLSTLHLSRQEDKPGLPRRTPGFDVQVVPGLPTNPPPD